jgi:hypothetical protein
MPGGRASAEGSWTVGPSRRAPPRRWTSAHMRGPDERRRLEQQPSAPRRVRRQRRSRASCDLPRCDPGRQRADDREETTGPNPPRPTPQARPARCSRGAHDGERAHAPADLGRCQLGVPPERQRQRDGLRRVQAPVHQAAGHHSDDRPAGLALIASGQDGAEQRRAPVIERAPPVPLAQTVPVQPQAPSHRPSRGPAGRAPPRPRLVHRRGTRDPPLDVEPTLYDSSPAPVAC